MKQLHLGVFEAPTPNLLGTVTWRHPENQSYRFAELEYWVELAQRLESSALDFLFLADSYGYAEVNGVRQDISFTEGLDLPRIDPGMLAASLAAVTTNLGLVVTASTLLEAPYANARRLSSLDHLSHGRLGWNVVTASFAETASALFGDTMPAHDLRYDKADEFMQLSYQLFEGSWHPDSVLADKKLGYADPALIHRIHHQGRFFKSDGYANTPPSPQGTPLLFQAGTSGRGRLFGATHGECIFLQGTTVELVAGYVRDIKQRAAALGRNPDSVKSVVGLSSVIAPTREQARRKYQEYLDLQTPEVAIASYSLYTGLDLSSYDPDTSFDELHTEMGQTQVERHRGRTIREVTLEFQQRGVRGFVSVGSPEDVADELCVLAEKTGVDGFTLEAWVQPGSTIDFLEHVLPLLRARGLFRHEYAETRLRERMLGTVGLRDDHPGAQYRRSNPSSDVESDTKG